MKLIDRGVLGEAGRAAAPAAYGIRNVETRSHRNGGLRGEKKLDKRSEEKGCYRLERAYGAFMRTIPLPEDVDVDKVDAKFENGVLTLRMAKTGTSKSSARKIEIK